ncbi:hypothetical protein ACFQ05_37580 [Amycolatopsis umgeniensis]|uniref:Uncharacterized protein n=1 Tax=Amycolatopsis umgeniensis TaxID=336628 RepID=A0A841AYH1_9PSEU|nr:hypothetical protein [Amycolatopsis umgeniensis]MBB5851138.1 hypothetical protein [Amycolatopsis umgeniensis]
MDDPFEAERGEQVRRTMMRLLAATGGAAGDFAGEVLAGRRQPHELLAHGPVLDEFVQDARELWRVIDAVPAEQRQRLTADAWAGLEQQVGELAEMDVDAAVAELRELATPAPTRHRDLPDDDGDDDWAERTYLEPL